MCDVKRIKNYANVTYQQIQKCTNLKELSEVLNTYENL